LQLRENLAVVAEQREQLEAHAKQLEARSVELKRMEIDSEARERALAEMEGTLNAQQVGVLCGAGGVELIDGQRGVGAGAGRGGGHTECPAGGCALRGWRCGIIDWQ
jgi:hypothetical protein